MLAVWSDARANVTGGFEGETSHNYIASGKGHSAADAPHWLDDLAKEESDLFTQTSFWR